MASNLKISTAARNAAVDAIATLLNGGTIKVRSGSPPTNVADADSGTLLATLTFGSPAFGSGSSGTATANSITSDSSADASADAGHFRLLSSAAATVIQGTAGEAADTPDMVFDEKSIVAGGVVACTSMTLTMPIQ